MPCYSIPTGSGLPEVAANFNREVITGLLRGRYGFDGVVCTDFNSLTGMELPGVVQLPPRNWGVEHLSLAEQVLMQLDAGVDQLGGETRPDWIVDAVRSGAVGEGRIDTSVRRILRDKFRLGLFDDPYVDTDAASALVGAAETRLLGRRVQLRSLVQLTGRAETLRTLPEVPALYVENIAPETAARYGHLVDRPEEADLAVLRLTAPYEKREGFLEQHFHAGSSIFPPPNWPGCGRCVRASPPSSTCGSTGPRFSPGSTPRRPCSWAASAPTTTSSSMWPSAARWPKAPSPFDLPSSMRAVEDSREDVPFDTAEPLFRCGHGAVAR